MDETDKETWTEDSDAKSVNSKNRLMSGKKSVKSSFNLMVKSLGPGVITGASDDDPSGIATYSQAGAQFGFGMLWLALFQYPLMTAIQEMCARIGLLTGSGLATVMKRKYSKRVIIVLTTLLLVANTINIGADIGAMAASVRLVFPQIPIIVAALSFAVFILGSEILIPYNKYVKILKYLTFSLFAYVVTAIIVGGNWNQILISSIIPHVEFTPAFAMMFVAIFGTTITPYVFFWQASQEAEEDVAKHKMKEIGKGKPRRVSKKEVKIMRLDTAIGMGFSQLIMWAIITTTAGSLHAYNVTDIQTTDQAARALQPLVKTFPNAGEIAKTIFALGIIGTGLLAIPVMAGSSAYALSDVFGWKEGLNKKFKQAKAFYLVIAASAIIGLLINFSSINPIKALVYAAVINGVIAVPILIAVMKIANDKQVLKEKVNGRISNTLGWLTVMIMGISVLIMFFTFIHK